MSDDVTTMISKIKRRLDETTRQSIIEVAARVYERTPVDTGDAQGDWSPEVNSYDMTNSGGSIPAVVETMKGGDTFYYSNSKPYIRRLEYDSHSMQAPRGMMRISIAQWTSIVRKTAKRLKRGS